MKLLGQHACDDQRAADVARPALVAREQHDVACADAERAHRNTSGWPRAWIAWRTPIATRFATIEDPPTVT